MKRKQVGIIYRALAVMLCFLLSPLPDFAQSAQHAGAVSAVRPEATRNATKVKAKDGVNWNDLLKTDTEGFDAKVIAGAQRMLSGGHVRCVLTEVGFVDDTQHTEFSSAFLPLHQYGFELAGIYEITYRRTPYDVASAASAIREKGLPSFLAERLFRGV